MVHAHCDKIYYNINIGYGQSSSDCAECSADVQFNSTEVILGRASDYYCSIVSFTIPTSTIPIFFPDIQQYPNTDVNNTVYGVAISYNGDVGSAFVQYDTSDQTAIVPSALSAQNPIAQRGDYYAIYSYTRFMNMVNKALRDAFAATVTPLGSLPPYLTFDQSTLLFTLVTDLNYDSSIPLPISVYMNYKLFQFFTGFDVTRVATLSPSSQTYKFNIVINNNLNLAADRILFKQDYSVITNWNCFRSLQLRSPLMPINQEFAPASGATTSTPVANRTPIIASYIPIYDNTAGNSIARSTVVFTLQSAFRLIDFVSDGSLTQISLSLFWTDELNQEYKLRLNYRELIQVKLMFHHRDSAI
jgi:hypothetical protein